MIKKQIQFMICALLFAGAAGAADRIVFIDLERVFNEFYKTQLAKSKVDVQQQDIDAERQIMVDEMNLLSAEVDTLKKEARDITLEEEVRDGKRLLYEERLLELRTKQKEIEEFVGRRQQQLQIQVSRMSQTIMDEIREAVVEYARQEGFQAVIDSSSRRAAVGVFIYTHPDVDITASVLTMLNSRRPDVLDDADLLGPDSESDEAAGEETGVEQP